MGIKFDNKELITAVESLKAGDKEAFEKIYELTYKKVYFFSFSITKNSDITDDIVQEIYINVFKNINNLKDNKLFIAWLNKITYNTTVKELDRISKKTLNMDIEEIQNRLIDENNPMIKYIEDESSKEIMKNILALKENYRTVIILKYFNNYKIKDIAKMLECPEGTVKSRLNAAKKELKEKLHENSNKITLLFGLTIILALTSRKVANATVNESNLKMKQKKFNITKLKGLFLNKAFFIVFLGVPVSIVILNNITIETGEKNILVEYNESFTNSNLEVIIKIDNLDKNDDVKIISNENKEINFNKLNKDTFLVDIESNGIYKIIINNQIVKSINIDNIDKEAPKIIDNINDGKIITISLVDNLSCIDYQKIEFFTEESKKIDLINVDKENNTVVIEATKGTKYLKIFDKAGNVALYKINIEKI